MTTGNSVADFRSVKETCVICDGSGLLSDDKISAKSIVEVLDGKYFNKKQIWRAWLNGIRSCPVCDGRGWTEEWR